MFVCVHAGVGLHALHSLTDTNTFAGYAHKRGVFTPTHTRTCTQHTHTKRKDGQILFQAMRG